MKKIIFLLLIALSSFQLFYSIQKISSDEFDEMNTVESTIAHELYLPDTISLSDPEQVFQCLLSTADDYHANVYRKAVQVNNDDSIDIVKYIMLTANGKFYNVFELLEGDFLSIEDTQNTDNDYYLSTQKKSDVSQKGVLRNHIKEYNVKIFPFYKSYEYMGTSGQYFVEIPEEELIHFLTTFTEKMNDVIGEDAVSVDDIVIGARNDELDIVTPNTDIYQKMYYILTGTVILAIAYYVFNSAKLIGIFKLYGISYLRCTLSLLFYPFAVIYMFSAFLGILYAFYVYKDVGFMIKTAMEQAVTFLLVFAISSGFSVLYIKFQPITYAIKRKKETMCVFVLNSILRFICVFFLISTVYTLLIDYGKLKDMKELYSGWSLSQDYGVFYPYYSGSDKTLEDGYKTESTINGELYPVLNEMGAVLVNARAYENQYLELNGSQGASLKVNPNFLNAFFVYDSNSEKIQIDENEESWILLVPEKYKEEADEIKEYCKEEKRTMYYEIDSEIYLREISDNILRQEIKIIWMENDQEIFSFNPDVFPENHNLVKDPIIEVVTLKNSCASDRECALGNGNTDPLKIKLIDRDNGKTYAALKRTLEKLGLEDNLKHLISVNQTAIEELEEIQHTIGIYIVFSIVGGTIMLLVSIQNISMHFNKNKNEYVVYKLFGVSGIQTYKNIIASILLFWAGETIVFLFLHHPVKAHIYLPILMIFVLFEFGLSWIEVTFIEKRNRISILKGA